MMDFKTKYLLKICGQRGELLDGHVELVCRQQLHGRRAVR